MARIIVTPDEHSEVVLLEERVYPVHLESTISSRQVIERVAWAVQDAEGRAGAQGKSRRLDFHVGPVTRARV